MDTSNITDDILLGQTNLMMEITKDTKDYLFENRTHNASNGIAYCANVLQSLGSNFNEMVSSANVYFYNKELLDDLSNIASVQEIFFWYVTKKLLYPSAFRFDVSMDEAEELSSIAIVPSRELGCYRFECSDNGSDLLEHFTILVKAKLLQTDRGEAVVDNTPRSDDELKKLIKEYISNGFVPF